MVKILIIWDNGAREEIEAPNPIGLLGILEHRMYHSQEVPKAIIKLSEK